MKTKLQLRTLAGMLLLLISPGAALAQDDPTNAPALPDHGMANGGNFTERLRAAVGESQAPPPAPPGEWTWIDPGWVDPDITLSDVNYDNLSAAEVAKDLRDRFKNTFDIMISPAWSDPARAVMQANDQPPDPKDWQVSLQLRQVTASEVFRAMNALFAAQNAPIRWVLTVNGKRQMALLRVIPELLDPAASSRDSFQARLTKLLDERHLPAPVEAKKPMVFYVGDLIGDEKTGGMTMDQLTSTLNHVSQMAYNGDFTIGFHKEAQLVIVKGTDEQIDFVRNTLAALKERVFTINKEIAEGNKKAVEAKTGDSGGSK